jgi:hypothetical protein
LQVLAGISFALVLVCAWGVALRLLALSRRTRGLPEASLGAMLLCLMGGGYPLAILAQAEPVLGLTACKWIQTLSNVLIDVGMAMPLLFTWHVFRRDSRAARVLCQTAVFLLAIHLGVAVVIVAHLDRMADAIPSIGLWAQVPLTIGALGFAWSGIESLRYRRLLARRAALGLSDPVVANRVALWGALGLVTAAGAVANSLFLLLHVDVVGDPIALAVTSCVGLAQAALLYLAFLPPRAYLAWVEGGQPA